MGIQIRAIILFFIISLLVAGCPVEPEPKIVAPTAQQSASPEAETLFNEAVAAFDAQNWPDAKERFNQFETEFPNDPLLGQVFLYQGRIAQNEQDFAAALSYFERVAALGEATGVYPYAMYYLGLLAFEQQNDAKAVEYLAPYAGRFASHTENITLIQTVVNAYARLNDRQNQILWSEKLLLAEPADEAAQQTISSAINSVRDVVATLEETELKRVQKQLSEKNTIWTLVTAQIARIQFENEQFDAATDTIEEIKESGRANAAQITDLIELIEKRNSVDMKTIGCLLPLSGKMRLVGQDALKGVMLASRKNRFGRENAPLSVVMRDTAGTGKTPEEIVEDLVLNERVSAIVGPMDVKYAKQIAAKAQRLGVPVILLSADNSASHEGNYVFRKFASNEKEVDALLQQIQAGDSADAQAPHTRFATLYPNNGYGKLMAKAFRKKVDEIGGAVTEVVFEPDTTDFGKAAASLAKADFTALFLPMTASQLALAAPALAAAGIWPLLPDAKSSGREVQYLIPSVGYSPSLVSRSGRYLQNAMFVQDFKVDASRAMEGFVRSFQDEYKSAPSSFAGYGYDAALLVSNAVKAGVNSRRELRTWLDETVGANGMIFPFRGFDENGEAEALPNVYKLTGNELK